MSGTSRGGIGDEAVPGGGDRPRELAVERAIGPGKASARSLTSRPRCVRSSRGGTPRPGPRCSRPAPSSPSSPMGATGDAAHARPRLVESEPLTWMRARVGSTKPATLTDLGRERRAIHGPLQREAHGRPGHVAGRRIERRERPGEVGVGRARPHRGGCGAGATRPRAGRDLEARHDLQRPEEADAVLADRASGSPSFRVRNGTRRSRAARPRSCRGRRR